MRAAAAQIIGRIAALDPDAGRFGETRVRMLGQIVTASKLLVVYLCLK